MIRLVLAVLLALLALAAGGAAAQLLEFSDAERHSILRHGPWPAPWVPDPSNRVSGIPQAIELGERLFFEPRLSPSGKVLCATCHAPFRGWQDARARALGLTEVERNTPSLLNVRYNRWFGWDGAGDSLWAQSVRPIADPREMGGSQAEAAALVRGDAELACRFEKLFGSPQAASDEAVLAAMGKALAAFQETLVTGRTPFDDFRDALARGDSSSMKNYSSAAQRGLRIFVGKGNCITCHFGPGFSNGEFHDTGVPFFVTGGVDPGRHGGIRKLQSSRFNLLGPYNDDGSGNSVIKTRHVSLEHRNFGEFKVPSLRNVAQTAPYMHNGSLATLADVVRHYSELNIDRLHADGESLLKPLRLSGAEAADLVAFLESLSEREAMLPPQAAARALLAMNVTLDSARMADLPQLVELLGILFTQERELRPDPVKQERGLRLILENRTAGRIHVLREGGRVLGMVNIMRSVSTAEGGPAGALEDFVVRPECRGRGLGARLLAYAIEKAREDGLLRLILLTDGDNVNAQRLYERAGFARSGMLPMRLKLR